MPNAPDSSPVVSPAPRRVVVAGVRRGVGEDPDATEQGLVHRARQLRDAGAEVIWAGTGLQVEQVAAIAVSEDSDEVEIAPGVAVADVSAALADLGAPDVEVVAVPET